MSLKCCTQHASKFGELSNGHWTGKHQFSFQSQRRAMPKKVQTTVQLCSFHILVRLCSKFSKQGFDSIWTKNFQKYKLGLEKAEEPEIKLPTLAGSWRKQGTPRKASTSALAFACADHNKLWKILKEMGIPDHLNLSPEKTECGSRSNS